MLLVAAWLRLEVAATAASAQLETLGLRVARRAALDMLELRRHVE